MAATNLTGPPYDEFTQFLEADPPNLTIENVILWLVETLADIQANPVKNPSQTKEVTEYNYNGLTGAVNIVLALQSESFAGINGVILNSASTIG